MLQRLTIEDFGLIPHAEIHFSRGATIFTGETGSGKTMVLGALASVLGGRAGAEMIRRGSGRAVITLEFDASAKLRQRLADEGFPVDADEFAVVTRELVAESSKSSMRLNGRPTTASFVRELATEIIDIAGQHEAQRLLSPGYHLDLLDRFAGAGALAARERVCALHAEHARIVKELELLDSDDRRAQERLVYAQFAAGEIESVKPQDGEDERLSQRRRVLDNSEKILQALRLAHEALAGEESSAGEGVGVAASALQGIADLAGSYAGLAQAVGALQSEIGDVAVQIAREAEAMEFDAGELEAVNERLAALDALKRKYGGSLSAVAASLDQFRATIETFANKDERRKQLRADAQRSAADLREAAAQLSQLRHRAAEKLSLNVERELREMAMPAARFSVEFSELPDIGAAGGESAQFIFAANKGEVQRPLARVASGGELSRVLLAVIVVLAGSRGGAALVFDEIDAGIGGATAAAVGARLGRLAQRTQVICVTHLAQIASWADAHYVLEKEEGAAATIIHVRAIGNDRQRTAEVARMLSGETHEAALRHARTLLAKTSERRAAG